MGSSKSFFLLFAFLVLLISSELEAAGRESTTDGAVDAKHEKQGFGHGDTGASDQVCPIRPCRFGCCRRCLHSRGCMRCCGSADEVPDAEFADEIKN